MLHSLSQPGTPEPILNPKTDLAQSRSLYRWAYFMDGENSLEGVNSAPPPAPGHTWVRSGGIIVSKGGSAGRVSSGWLSQEAATSPPTRQFTQTLTLQAFPSLSWGPGGPAQLSHPGRQIPLVIFAADSDFVGAQLPGASGALK